MKKLVNVVYHLSRKLCSLAAELEGRVLEGPVAVRTPV